MLMHIRLPSKPVTLPIHVFLGLILGRIFFFPNVFPKKNANVSHVHKEINIAKVKIAPASCLKNIRELIKTPTQIKPNTVLEILNKGVDDFLNRMGA